MYIYVSLEVCTHVHMYTCIHVHMYIYININAQRYLCLNQGARGLETLSLGLRVASDSFASYSASMWSVQLVYRGFGGISELPGPWVGGVRCVEGLARSLGCRL